MIALQQVSMDRGRSRKDSWVAEDSLPRKKARLSLACNVCRRRKVKCDAEYPKCRNCSLRNDTCITTDPKGSRMEVVRSWVDMGQPEPDPDESHLGPRRIASKASQHSAQEQGGTVVSQATVRSTEGIDDLVVAEPDNHGISPVQQPYGMSFNMDHNTNKFKMLGGSSSQCLIKSLDIYMHATSMTSVTKAFRDGMQHAEEVALPLHSMLIPMPDLPDLELYMNAFFNNIHRLYPMFDANETKSNVRQLAQMTDYNYLSHEQVVILASSYLILSIGADEVAQQPTEDGTRYLSAATSILGHVILMPYLPAIQALICFAIAYLGRNKDGVAWQMIGTGIRIAHTLGLHRHSAKSPSSQHGIQQLPQRLFHARIWGICCCIEKIMQLESGRPSLVDSVDDDQMMARDQQTGEDFLTWNIRLAQHQGLICEHIYGYKPGKHTAKELLLETARLDRSMIAWASEIPEEFRPGNDLFCSTENLHIAAFISIQYHQTMISLHRAALVSGTASFQAEVDEKCAGLHSRIRLRSGENICVSSARAIAKAVIELSDRGVDSRIITAAPGILACIVLGIHLVKNPQNGLQASDFELFKACVDYTANQLAKSGHSESFVGGVRGLYDQIRSCVDRRLLMRTDGKTGSQLEPQPTVGIQRGDEPFSRSIQERSHNAHLGGELPIGHERVTIESRAENPVSVNQIPYANPGPHLFEELGSPRNGDGGVTLAPLELGMNHEIYGSDQIPFGNLDYEEIWAWMLPADPESAEGVRGY